MKSEYLFGNTSLLRISWFCSVTFFSCVLTSSSLAQATSSPEDGLYTSVQAEQGKKLYATRRAACHGADLGGQSAPPLAGPQFERSWISTTTLDDLFYLIRCCAEPTQSTKDTTPVDALRTAHCVSPFQTHSFATLENLFVQLFAPAPQARCRIFPEHTSF
jgi:hypothetical protein